MITVDGGFVKIVNQEIEVVNGQLELRLFARMYYATNEAKTKLDVKLFHLNYFEKTGMKDDDVRVKRVTIDPFEEVKTID